MTQLQEITIPPIGDYESVPIIEVLITKGDRVEEDQTILILESDKATLDIPAPCSGIIEDLSVQVGQMVSVGHSIGHIRPEKKSVSSEKKRENEVASPPSLPHSAPDKKSSQEKTHDTLPYASPSVRKEAREKNIDLTTLSGTGKQGRITKDDLAKHGLPPSSPHQRIARSRIQKLSAQLLVDSWTTVPHVTTCEDADITDLEQFRLKLNEKDNDNKVTLLAFLMKICSSALSLFPVLNSSLDGDDLVLKNEYNIGFAVDTPQGLIVPVIHHADRYGIKELSAQIKILSEKARKGKITPQDISGGTFSISSLGGIGGTYFTPLIRPPEVAILGVCRSQRKPIWMGHSFEPRLILPLSLSWDHRVVDGAMAARFNLYLKNALEDLRVISI